MARMATCLLLAFWFVTAQSASAQERGPGSDLNVMKETIERAVTAWSIGGSADALAKLVKEHWCNSSEAASAAAAVQSQLDAGFRTVELQIGKPIAGAVEFVGATRVGKSLVKFVNLQKRQYSVIPIVVACYKAGTEWKITGILFGDKAMDDMKAVTVVEPAK